MISFIPINEPHIPMMHQWLNHGEVLRWYAQKRQTEEEIRRKYLVDKLAEGTRCVIIEYDGENVGYAQYYAISNHPEYAVAVGAKEHDWGIDLFIGNDERLGNGLGEIILKAALDNLIFLHKNVKRCLLDTDPENARAIRCYEKCGFRHSRTLKPSDGILGYIMVVDNPRIEKVPKRKPSPIISL